MFFVIGKLIICVLDVIGSRSLRVINFINVGILLMIIFCGLFFVSFMMMAIFVVWFLFVSDNDSYRSIIIWFVAVNKSLFFSRLIKFFSVFIGFTVCELEGLILILKISNVLIIFIFSDCRLVKWSGTILRSFRLRGFTYYVLRWF